MILIGSKALNLYVDVGRKMNDTDLVGTYDEIVEYIKATKPVGFYPISGGRKMLMRYANGNIVEADIAWKDSVEEKLMNFILRDASTFVTDFLGIMMHVPSLDVLYMLKMSHRYLKNSPHFLKTMADIKRLREADARILPSHTEFYAQRQKDTYTYTLPKLNVSKDAFFDEVSTGVVYTYDHDSIHQAVRHLDKPAYQYYSGGDVWSDKEKFFAQTQEVRLYGVLEESYVLALERSLIPFPNGKTPKEAFDMALIKVCTSITSGWFREFAWEHYEEVQMMYNDSFVDKFNTGVLNGTVLRNA